MTADSANCLHGTLGGTEFCVLCLRTRADEFESRVAQLEAIEIPEAWLDAPELNLSPRQAAIIVGILSRLRKPDADPT